MKENVEDIDLCESLKKLNEELDEVLELLDVPLQEYNKRKTDENVNEKKIENEIPEIVKKRDGCCC